MSNIRLTGKFSSSVCPHCGASDENSIWSYGCGTPIREGRLQTEECLIRQRDSLKREVDRLKAWAAPPAALDQIKSLEAAVNGLKDTVAWQSDEILGLNVALSGREMADRFRWMPPHPSGLGWPRKRTGRG